MVSFHQFSTSGLLVYQRVHPHDYPQVIPSSKLTVRACPDSGWFPPKIGDFQDLQWMVAKSCTTNRMVGTQKKNNGMFTTYQRAQDFATIHRC